MSTLTYAPGVEGDYDEILAWMDENPVTGVKHAEGRGVGGYTEEGNFVTFNVGLFSVVADEGWKGTFMWTADANVMREGMGGAHEYMITQQSYHEDIEFYGLEYAEGYFSVINQPDSKDVRF